MAKTSVTTTTGRVERTRQFAKAQSMAKTELTYRHPDEYRHLFEFYCEHLGIERPLPRRGHVPAPPYEPEKA